MMVDLHHHLVYGVDDGAQDRDMAIAMMQRAVQEGITDIVCTSHTMPGHHELDLPAYEQRLAELQRVADHAQMGLHLHSGSEVLCTSQTAKKLYDGEIPILGESWNVLLEFRPDTPFVVMNDRIMEITNRGYGVVLAHVERYGCLRERGVLAQLREECGIKAQMNAGTVLRAKGLLGDRWSRQMLRDHMIDVVASDAHDTEVRPCRLGEAFTFLEKTYGRSYAEELCCDTPAMLMSRQ